jgi:hypothetical protein
VLRQLRELAENDAEVAARMAEWEAAHPPRPRATAPPTPSSPPPPLSYRRPGAARGDVPLTSATGSRRRRSSDPH